jgi:hypothetical protein
MLLVSSLPRPPCYLPLFAMRFRYQAHQLYLLFFLVTKIKRETTDMMSVVCVVDGAVSSLGGLMMKLMI